MTKDDEDRGPRMIFWEWFDAFGWTDLEHGRRLADAIAARKAREILADLAARSGSDDWEPDLDDDPFHVSIG